jgi:HEAT repeat protein
MIGKRFVFCAAFAAVSAAVFAQAGNSGMTVEQSFLQDSIEMMIIREQSRAESREMKLVALEYIAEAITKGNKAKEIREALEFLTMEGIRNQSREEGRLLNNFPDVRARAARELGRIGTTEAKTALIRLLMDDNEPMVLTEAVRSLGLIGMNDDDDTVNAITWVVGRYDNALSPDNLLALAALEAYEKLAAANGSVNFGAVQVIMKIADGNYIRPVQARAKALLMTLRGQAR